MSERIFRFAPSPNGPLHLGHAYSALLNHGMARTLGARFLLRHEDIDLARCTDAYRRAAEETLAFLGISWDGEPRRQSHHFAEYGAALDILVSEDLVYPAFMSRSEIRAHAARHQEKTGEEWRSDPDGAPLYPRLDRNLSDAERTRRIEAGDPFAWRLDMEEARRRTGRLSFEESGAGPKNETGRLEADPALWGDVVIARREIPTSYHLAVVVDDARQGVTDVVRGRDLFRATSVQRVLQTLLGLPEPRYFHHQLILDPTGRKLSKSDRDAGIDQLRAAGLTREDIARRVGLDPAQCALSPERAARR